MELINLADDGSGFKQEFLPPTDSIFEKMDPEVKAIWVNALRDPAAKQTTGTLRNKEGMCCLGVLTECAIDAGIKVNREFIERDHNYEYTWKDEAGELYTSTADLPLPVMEWAGLVTSDPVLEIEIAGDGYPNPVVASNCNDSKEYDFGKIADLIETNL